MEFIELRARAIVTIDPESNRPSLKFSWWRANMKNQKSSKTLQNGFKSTQTEANTTPNTKHKVSQFYLHFLKISHLEQISSILIHCLKFESILMANIEPGLPVHTTTNYSTNHPTTLLLTELRPYGL